MACQPYVIAHRFQFQRTPVLRVLLHLLKPWRHYRHGWLRVLLHLQEADGNLLYPAGRQRAGLFIHYKTFFQVNHCTSPSYFREVGEVTVDPSRPISVLP